MSNTEAQKEAGVRIIKDFLIGYRAYGYVSLFIVSKFGLVAAVCIFLWLVDYENPNFLVKIGNK